VPLGDDPAADGEAACVLAAMRIALDSGSA